MVDQYSGPSTGGTGAQVRADFNNTDEAILTMNAGPSEPSVVRENMFWRDTLNQIDKQRNRDNNDWEFFRVWEQTGAPTVSQNAAAHFRQGCTWEDTTNARNYVLRDAVNGIWEPFGAPTATAQEIADATETEPRQMSPAQAAGGGGGGGGSGGLGDVTVVSYTVGADQTISADTDTTVLFDDQSADDADGDAANYPSTSGVITHNGAGRYRVDWTCRHIPDGFTGDPVPVITWAELDDGSGYVALTGTAFGGQVFNATNTDDEEGQSSGFAVFTASNVAPLVRIRARVNGQATTLKADKCLLSITKLGTPPGDTQVIGIIPTRVGGGTATDTPLSGVSVSNRTLPVNVLRGTPVANTKLPAQFVGTMATGLNGGADASILYTEDGNHPSTDVDITVKNFNGATWDSVGTLRLETDGTISVASGFSTEVDVTHGLQFTMPANMYGASDYSVKILVTL